MRPLEGEPLIGTVTAEVSLEGAADRVDIWLDDRLTGSLREAPWIHTFDAGFSSEVRRLRVVVWRDGMATREVIEHSATPFTVGASIDVDLVEVPIRLRSSRRPAAASLEIREAGRPQEILELRAARPDSRFVVVLDRSLSMRGGRLDRAVEAVEWLRSQLRAGDSLELIYFNHTVSSPLRPADDEQPITAPVASGGTALFDALTSVTTRERDIVIVISDTDDRHSVSRADAVRSHLTTRGVTIYSVALSRGNAAGMLGEMADATGGLSLRHDDALSGVQDVLRDVNGRVIAVYQSTSHAAGWRPIVVRSRDSGVRVLSARKGYTAR